MSTLPLNMYQTAVHWGVRLEFAPVKRVEQPEFSKEEGREGAYGTQKTISSPNTMTTPPTTTLMNSVSFLHRAEREVDG